MILHLLVIMTNTIALIGAGGIGSRHLQSLSLLDGDYLIQVVDPSSESIVRAKELLSNESDGRIDNIKYYSDIESLDCNIDVAIIAVTSAIRRKVTEDLLSKIDVANIIFEKVLFNKIEDYFFIQNLLQKKECHLGLIVHDVLGNFIMI